MICKIGLDIEFGVRKNGQFMPAHDVFSREIGTSGTIGLDGHPQTGELRPDASTNLVEVVTNMYAAFKYVNDIFVENHITLHAGQWRDGKAIGGHVHFGIGEANIGRRSAIVPYLDHFLDKIVSNKTDDAAEKRLRIERGYGELSAIRSKPYGFEYRTPGSFIHNPQLSMVYLTLSKLSSIAAIDRPFSASKYPTSRDVYTNARELFDEAVGVMARNNITEDIDDCLLGLDVIKDVFKRTPSINWEDNILGHWSG